jgi:hypothetical protein
MTGLDHLGDERGVVLDLVAGDCRPEADESGGSAQSMATCIVGVVMRAP